MHKTPDLWYFLIAVFLGYLRSRSLQYQENRGVISSRDRWFLLRIVCFKHVLGTVGAFVRESHFRSLGGGSIHATTAVLYQLDMFSEVSGIVLDYIYNILGKNILRQIFFNFILYFLLNA